MSISERPEAEDAALKNRTMTARLAWQPRNHDPQLRKWLHRIKVPTLLVWGADDRLFPPDYAFAFAQLIPGAKTVVLPQCGHFGFSLSCSFSVRVVSNDLWQARQT